MRPELDRLRRVGERCRWISIDDASLIESQSNDVWRIGPQYLRVCWRGDRSRLEREVALSRWLPPDVPYPSVLETGSDGDLSWVVTKEVVGENAGDNWRGMPARRRRAAIHASAAVLEALHSWSPPAEVLDLLRRPESDDPELIAGSDMFPLPTERVAVLLGAVAENPFSTPELVHALGDRLTELGQYESSDASELRVVHSDFSLTNVLWDGHRVTAALDFEWARAGAPDMDLLSFATDPHTDAESLEIGGWIAEAYPDVFDHPHIVERLWLYELSYAIRQFVVFPPRSSVGPARLHRYADTLPAKVVTLARAAGI